MPKETPAPALSVSRLRLADFRNYAQAALDLDARCVVLTGPNGAGKTNILEAVSMLTPGRGLRRAKVAEMDRVTAGPSGPISGGPWSVAATLQTPTGPLDIGTGRDPESDRRIVRLDGAAQRGQTALGDFVSAVWLTPQMDRLFQDSSAERRRFLDRLIYGFDPAHAGRLNAYDKALRQRARLLREEKQDPAWLDALEAQMIERGIAISAARRAMTIRLNRACDRSDGPFPGARLNMNGTVDSWLGAMSALEAEDRFAATLKESRQRDAEAGGATAGPHRADVTVRHLEKGLPAAQCSTGEQKALVTAIVLAHARLQQAERGAGPILLLDEVTAHLDSERRSALFETVLGLGLQAWITGTDQGTHEGLGEAAQFFEINAARIAQTSSRATQSRL